MLKQPLKNALKTIEKTHLYIKEAVYYNGFYLDRRNHNGSGLTTTGMNAIQIATLKNNYAKDLNIDERITKFKEQLKNEYVYRIPLRYFADLDKFNFATKIDYRIKFHLEKDMKRLFESGKVLATGTAIPGPDAKIIFTIAPYIQ